jgi:hypothetical protein
LILVPLAYRLSAAKMSVTAPVTIAPTASKAGSPAPSESVSAATTPIGLVLTLGAKRECWIRTHVDGGQPLERVLKADEAIILRANEEIVLRVGDAAAVVLLINNRAARPLGKSGEVVTARITPSNYLDLLEGDRTP